MMRSVLTLALTSAPAGAVPPPLFFCENADGSQVQNLQIPAEEPRFAFGYGDPAADEGQFEIIMDCRRGGALYFAIDAARSDWQDAQDVIDRAHNAFSQDGTPYKLKRLARLLKKHGARAELRDFSRKSCACDPDTYQQY